jgi:hypothetical protein
MSQESNAINYFLRNDFLISSHLRGSCHLLRVVVADIG